MCPSPEETVVTVLNGKMSADGGSETLGLQGKLVMRTVAYSAGVNTNEVRVKGHSI